MARGLTPKQQRFVEEYLVDLNSSAAARRAGYTGDANTIGPRLLANVGVSQQIAAGRKRLSESTQRTIADAMADIRRRGQMAEDEGEWGPAIKAAELEAKHLGAFVERLEHTGPGGGPLQQITRIELVARRQ